MTNEERPSKKSSGSGTKKRRGTVKKRPIKALRKELSKEIGKQVNMLTKAKTLRDATVEDKSVIDLKLRIMKHLKDQLDDIEGCTFDGCVVDDVFDFSGC